MSLGCGGGGDGGSGGGDGDKGGGGGGGGGMGSLRGVADNVLVSISPSALRLARIVRFCLNFAAAEMLLLQFDADANDANDTADADDADDADNANDADDGDFNTGKRYFSLFHVLSMI